MNAHATPRADPSKIAILPHTNPWFVLMRSELNAGDYVIIERKISGQRVTHADEGSLLTLACQLEADARFAIKTRNLHLLTIARCRLDDLTAVWTRLKLIYPEL